MQSALLSTEAWTLSLVPPLAPWLHSFSWKLFTVLATDSLPLTLTHTHTHTHTNTLPLFPFSFSFLAPILDISLALTWKLSLCHLDASGVQSSSFCVSVSLSVSPSCPPPAPSSVTWRAEEKRREEETVDFACSKYSLHVCGVLSSKGRRDMGWFISFVIASVCVCVQLFGYVTECALILANIKDAPSSISLSFFSLSSSLPLPLSLILPLASFCLHCLFVCVIMLCLCLPVCFGASRPSCMCLVGCDSIEKSPKR